MKNLTALLMAMVISFTIAASSVYARDNDATFRCSNDIIALGYTMYQVRSECGEPDSSQIVGEKRLSDSDRQFKTGEIVYITEWSYGRDDGIYVLTFEGSRLVKKEFFRDWK